MKQEDDPASANEGGGKAFSKENADLRRRLEVYRWLFWAAVFFIVVLIVARCAHS